MTRDAGPRLFQLEDVAFRYHRKSAPVFDGFTRAFPVGLTLLRGPSGGGKSTLLKLLAGYLPPCSGRVLTRHGRPPDRDFCRREAGFVFQQHNLLPGTSLRRNLELAGLIAGLSGAALGASIDEWLGRLGLRGFERSPVDRLSGGQAQRAALARALVKRPAVLILDEPTSGLDDASTRFIGEVVLACLAEGRSALVSTHDPRLPAVLGASAADTLFLGPDASVPSPSPSASPSPSP